MGNQRSAGAATGHVHSRGPIQHRSRREIDLAIGVLMGIRRCSVEDAWAAIIEAVGVTGIGPGGVSRALLNIVTGGAEPALDDADAHWKATLSHSC